MYYLPLFKFSKAFQSSMFMFTKFINIRSSYIAMIFPWVSYDGFRV